MSGAALAAPAALDAAARGVGLIHMGSVARGPQDADLPQACRAIALFGMGSGSWAAFTAAQEYTDGQPHPLDRWSRRMVGGLAESLNACGQRFPSDGPVYPPFIRWALASGSFYLSPVGMMVHRDVGLMISLRGALLLQQPVPAPPDHPSPCNDCPAPCRTACPVDALRAGYDLSACHGWLDDPSSTCLRQGCAARRACPLSAGAGRSDAQSAFHMRAFHPCA